MPDLRNRAKRPARIASCEPCRLSKLSCDHGRPLCGRCARKGSQCVYRKDPFKRTSLRASSRASAHAAQISPCGQPAIDVSRRPPWHASNLSPVSEPEPPALPLQLTLYPNAGFQGSSSLDTILDTVERGARYDAHGGVAADVTQGASTDVSAETGAEASVDTSVDAAPGTGAGTSGSTSASASGAGTHASNSGDDASVPGTMLVMSGTAMIEEGAQVLELLATLLAHSVLQQLFDEWRSQGLEVHIGSLLVRPFLDTMTDVLEVLDLDVLDTRPPVTGVSARRAAARTLSRRLFHAAKASTDVDSAASLQDFADRYTGTHLRWETVGLILALAGNAVSKLRAPHAVYATEPERHALGRNLLHASNRCASFCESLDILNDVQIIFLYESFLLHSVYFGHQSFRAWCRLNTAINALFGRGLHQRLDHDGTRPFFLVELRKHIFALLYGSDMNFSVFLGRPPRISRRHCVIHMPLDVAAEAYDLPADAQQLRQLDACGWNTLGQIRPHAVIRWSMITSEVREETLEATLGPDVPDRDGLISRLRVKIDDAWHALPPFLAVPAREVWATRRPGQQTDTLYLIRLYYLQTLFLIEWTASIHGTGNLDALFVVAGDLLAWVNEAIIMRERLNRLGLNTLAWRVSAFGLPAAGALAKCLLAETCPSPPSRHSPSTLSKAIRDLSVLIAHMDYLYDASDGNDKLFSRAKGILVRVIESTVRRRDTDGSGGPANTADRCGRSTTRVAPRATDGTSPINIPMMSPPSNSEAYDPWEFRPELWIGLPGPNLTEVNHMDLLGEFTQFLD